MPEFVRLNTTFGDEPYPVMVTGLSHIHKAHFLSGLVSTHKPLLVIVSTESEASRLVDDINFFSGGVVSAVLPARDINLGNIETVADEYERRRLTVLHGLLGGKLAIAVATAESASQVTIPKGLLREKTIKVSPNDSLTTTGFAEQLTRLGYERADLVSGAGQFSIRGDIIDVFAVQGENPVRIELYGDEVDTVSVFDTETQRRIDTVKFCEIVPAMEFVFDHDKLAVNLNALTAKARGVKATQVREKLLADLDRLEGGLPPKNPSKYHAICYDAVATAFDYVADVIICEHIAAEEGHRTALSRFDEDLRLQLEAGEICRGLERQMLTKSEYADKVSSLCRAYLEIFARGGELKLAAIVETHALSLSAWSGEYKLLTEELSGLLSRGYAVIIAGGTTKAAKQLADDLRTDGFAADFSAGNPGKAYAKRAYVIPGTATSGYDYPTAKCAFLALAPSRAAAERTAERDSPKPKEHAAHASAKRGEIKNLTEINQGDYVVHRTHGIAVFEGVVKLTDDGVSRDYIKLKYAGTDVLYTPVTQLDMLSRYIGNTDGGSFKLSKLHTDQWTKAKSRAKAAADELADELIALYKQRMASKGYAFAKDGAAQNEFENRFQFIETDDQMRSAFEIKRDMETPRPMERLLCGDVGFGKTEVAFRAAFKALQDGKQVALLCPTTVLAWQHYQTAVKRFEGFNFNIELLSRFRSPKEIKETIERAERGIADFVIGTHRLIQEDVKWRNLGLAIIDEEQRFGVTHKERFKKIFAGVDLLTLSATPIPRTLNMAMSGVRDMSVIETPPQDRMPITTYVVEHDLGVIASAIEKELRRNGQVYYIHNRIETIFDCAASLNRAVPTARIGVAHGKMGEEDLLEVWRRLLDREIDVLVCTTLIETGVDVPNANTLVIENADYMGLAQLHQLRGRVGRTNRRAFAYFTYKRGKLLTEIATKRLEAVKEFTRFGSGFRIAMKDLEIRGAGSILGERQSGHLSAIGYDLYLKMLSESVSEKQNGGEKSDNEAECLVDIKVNAFIPEEYIGNQAQRIACYKRIAEITSDDDAFDVTDELIDRYGEPPRPVRGLISVALIRAKACAFGINDIIQHGNTLTCKFDRFEKEKWGNGAKKLGRKLSFDFGGKTAAKITLDNGESPIDALNLLIE
ncbi:MAG: transcription-repair coupling factor [Oscillospiraceae bacterium]|nr:transcription-repair coupling factor [Oscillospiraceae bacterium]